MPSDSKKNSNHSFKQLIQALSHKRMLIVFLMGFSSGLPYMLIADNLSLWLRTENISLKTIGFMGWVTIPYSLKFLWSFFMDRYSLTKLGRRRSWMLFSQLGLCLSLFFLGLQNPNNGLFAIAVCGILAGFFSASQDISIDAYRREILNDNEQGIGSALANYGYRLGVLVASGFGVWIVSPHTFNFTFGQSFQLMSALMGIGILTTFWAQEPTSKSGTPQNLKESMIAPLKDFFVRPHSLLILAFIIFYKFGDAMAGKMLSPFYVDLGFQLDTLAITRKAVGLYSSLAGLAVGGSMIYMLGLYRSLWICGILQALSTICFSFLIFFGAKLLPLAVVMSIEDFTAGMGTAALMAFLALLTNQKFTATQFALLSSLATVGRNFFSGYSGKIVETLGDGTKLSGFFPFFVLCGLAAIPGLCCLIPLKKTKVFS
jgi:PAT family beta-lactamase induction signal transducer AmpG